MTYIFNRKFKIQLKTKFEFCFTCFHQLVDIFSCLRFYPYEWKQVNINQLVEAVETNFGLNYLAFNCKNLSTKRFNFYSSNFNSIFLLNCKHIALHHTATQLQTTVLCLQEWTNKSKFIIPLENETTFMVWWKFMIHSEALSKWFYISFYIHVIWRQSNQIRKFHNFRCKI